MRLSPALVVIALLTGCSGLPPAPQPASYAEALATWRQPEDINAWIGARFGYDEERALELSESQRARASAPPIHEPATFFGKPEGMCVDLARFAVESLRVVAPELEPRYLMIEFTPALRSGEVLRRHWVATFRRPDGHYFFADSNRPGKIAGPYPSTEAFVTAYADYRQREIVAYRALDTYLRQGKALAKQARATPVAQRDERPVSAPISKPPNVEFAGGDGNGCDRAVVIRGSRGARDAVQGEIAWLRTRYPGYKFLDNTVETRGGRSFEEITFETAAGQRKAVCFDITEGFGNL